jgi:hypothetical protein
MANKPKRKSPAGRPTRKEPVRATGAFFRSENPVAARFLLDILSGKNSLGPDFGRAVRLDWHSRDAGWLADELTVSSQTTSGEKRATELFVKRYLQWLDMNATRHFKRGDAVLATGDLADDVA